MSMSSLAAAALAALFCLATAGAADAQVKTVTLPADHESGRLKPGAGSELVLGRCAVCHSTDYIVTQPRGDARYWEAIVTKMMRVYGAPVSDTDARAIVEYLSSQYGPVR